MDLLWAVAAFALERPGLTLGALWMGSVQWARKRGMSWWWIGFPMGAVWLYKNRRDLRGVILWTSGALLVGAWALLLWSRPGLRFAAGVAIPMGLSVGGIVWLALNYGEYPIHHAAWFAWAEHRSREVVTDAVVASVGEGARVLSVKPLGNTGEFEAVIGGPPGMSHGDLIEHLRDSLAESIRAQSGLVMRDVAVTPGGAKGAVKVRCSTSDPYRQTMRLEDM